ncbi:hypothetical protein DMN91_010546 [Ooceraea biroi]|uniref:PiggyBac transposable element-derived protein domain-containing protein n=1 Tax=Ooceraea biroi TaxID=2015173 RepID=A0A3L8D9A0_OOCBI|nr:hypothetical protein DMN91_010546 [Ooceraea biroi]
MMAKSYARTTLKQFIRGKPIRFGLKFWGICTSDGFLLDLDLYCGQNSNYHLYFDNFFTSFDLVLHLQKLGLRCTGTIRENRVSEKNVIDKKFHRGTYVVKHDQKKWTWVVWMRLIQAAIVNALVIYNATGTEKEKIGSKDFAVGIAQHYLTKVPDTMMNHNMLLGSDLLKDLLNANIRLIENNAMISKREDISVVPCEAGNVPEVFCINAHEMFDDSDQQKLDTDKIEIKPALEKLIETHKPHAVKEHESRSSKSHKRKEHGAGGRKSKSGVVDKVVHKVEPREENEELLLTIINS